MTRRVVKHPEVHRDLLDTADYLARDSVDAALRFLENTEASFQRLLEMPGIGRLREFSNPRLADLRSFPVKGFEKHLIFYRSIPEGIEVLRVIHGARNLEEIFR